LNPTLQTKINKQFGFNEIVNDNSFSSLLLCEGDIHFASLLDKLSTDWQDDHKNINARSNLSIYLLRFAPNHNDAFNAYSNLTYRRLEIQDNEIHLKEYIKIHLNIEIVGDISINDLDLLEQKTKDQYDEEITNRIKGYYDILKLKNDLIQQLNWIIENDDLSNIEHLPEFDKDTMKYINILKDNLKKETDISNIEQFSKFDDNTKKYINILKDNLNKETKMRINRLILERFFSIEMANILTKEIKISDFKSYLDKDIHSRIQKILECAT
jgi:hypothetical protein